MGDLLIDQGDGVVWSREKNRALTAQELIDRIREAVAFATGLAVLVAILCGAVILVRWLRGIGA